MEGYRGNTEAAICFYKEALKTSPTVSEFIELVRSVAALKSQEGFHKSALKDLENLIPLVRYAEPRLCYDLLNSYAVELCEANRLEEAREVSHLAISSPFGPYYPQWQETFAEVSQKLYKSRSRVTVSLPESKPVCEPDAATRPEPVPAPQQGLARILKFPGSRPPEIGRTETLRPETRREVPVALTPIQWLAVVLKVMLTDRVTDEEIERICSSYHNLIIDFYG
ncbi:MAG TPA: tetratricopeptide repeat protein [Blastocatellia bacterium]|nr:tetratricopeptide repeat protein [Blastocatellia bacterium]